MEISKMEGDLSRRALMYELKGLSYREYLAFSHDIILPTISLESLLNHDYDPNIFIESNLQTLTIFQKIILCIRVLSFFTRWRNSYHHRLATYKNDCGIRHGRSQGLWYRTDPKKILRLNIISQQVPFKPNITSLAEKSGIHRNSVNNYLYYLEEARLIAMLQHHSFSVASFRKTRKNLFG